MKLSDPLLSVVISFSSVFPANRAFLTNSGALVIAFYFRHQICVKSTRLIFELLFTFYLNHNEKDLYALSQIAISLVGLYDQLYTVRLELEQVSLVNTQNRIRLIFKNGFKFHILLLTCNIVSYQSEKLSFSFISCRNLFDGIF